MSKWGEGVLTLRRSSNVIGVGRSLVAHVRAKADHVMDGTNLQCGLIGPGKEKIFLAFGARLAVGRRSKKVVRRVYECRNVVKMGAHWRATRTMTCCGHSCVDVDNRFEGTVVDELVSCTLLDCHKLVL